MIAFMVLCVLSVIVTTIIDVIRGTISPYFNTFMLCGYLKDLISFVKYAPQVLINYRRKCTVGWSIWGVILDLGGGMFSYL